MKDSYSFDLDEAGLRSSYAAHREAYVRTFDRLGLPYIIVAAVSGAMGGSASEEFLAPPDAGEDSFVLCPQCHYAANVEAANAAVPPARHGGAVPPVRMIETLDTATISSLVEFVRSQGEVHPDGRESAAADMLKNVIVMLTHPDGTREPIAIGLPGDRELDMKRLQAHVEPAQVAVFIEADFVAHPQLMKGYIGPRAVGAERGLRYLVDPRVVDGSVWVSGADEPGRHLVNLVAGRDFAADGTIDVAEIRKGDPCAVCGSGLSLRHGVELGHVFQLGRKYSEALDLRVAGPDGHPLPVLMGSYGIGVSRAVAAIAESTLDEKGLCWPREVAPADVHLLVAVRDVAAIAVAEQRSRELSDRAIRVLLDGRESVSAGVKFEDAELIGVPRIVVVGKGVANGVVECRDRRTGSTSTIPIDTAADVLSVEQAESLP
jgi:prolyl-tRNA synthetase